MGRQTVCAGREERRLELRACALWGGGNNGVADTCRRNDSGSGW
jgi:hypothetical protein